MPHRPSPSPLLMRAQKRIALIAHDHCKDDLLDWARFCAAVAATQS